MTLVTHQTGPEGKEVGRVYVEEGTDIARELYLSMPDRPGDLAHHLHGLDRRRHGHRGGGGEDARKDHSWWRSIRRPAFSRSTPASLA
jgi:hypothetical protein